MSILRGRASPARRAIHSPYRPILPRRIPPFADCLEEDCENHGVNVFEVMGRNGRGRRLRVPYTKNGPLRVHCNGRRRSTEKRCGASITLGSKQPRGHSSPEKRKETKLALFLIRLGLSPTHANGFDLTTDFFGRCPSEFRRAIPRLSRLSKRVPAQARRIRAGGLHGGGPH